MNKNISVNHRVMIILFILVFVLSSIWEANKDIPTYAQEQNFKSEEVKLQERLLEIIELEKAEKQIIWEQQSQLERLLQEQETLLNSIEELKQQKERLSFIVSNSPYVYAEVYQINEDYTIFTGTDGKYYSCKGHWEYDTPYLLDVFADDIYGVWVIDDGGVEE